MNLIDIREPSGPYWAAYQATRERDGIADNPDFVPEWFVAKLARQRVAAARVALEQLGAEPMDVFGSAYQRELTSVWGALSTIEHFIRETRTHDPATAQVIAGLLGAQEIETERVEQPDHDTRLRAAHARAEWELADATWADVIIGAYLDPEGDTAKLAEEQQV